MVKTSAGAENLTSAEVLTCRYNRPVQYGRDAAHKSRAACAFRSLEVYMYERQHYLRGSERELYSQTWRKSAVGDSAKPK